MDSGRGAAGRVGLQPFADQHDEHGLGSRQILTDGQRGDDRDTNGEVGRDVALEQGGDGVAEDPIATENGQDGGGIDSENGGENAGEVQ